MELSDQERISLPFILDLLALPSVVVTDLLIFPVIIRIDLLLHGLPFVSFEDKLFLKIRNHLWSILLKDPVEFHWWHTQFLSLVNWGLIDVGVSVSLGADRSSLIEFVVIVLESVGGLNFVTIRHLQRFIFIILLSNDLLWWRDIG